MQNRRAFIVACASAVPLAGCASDTEPQSGGGGQTDTSTSTEQAELSVGHHQLNYDEYGYASVSGTVTNETDRNMGYVQLSAYLYDGETRIGEGLWNASNLGAGIRAQFETTPVQYDYRPTGYELRISITY